MSDPIVEPTTQTAPAGNADVVTISKAEYEDITHRAGVSSQNYERLQAALREKEELEAQLVGNNPSPVDNEKLRELSETVRTLQDANNKTDLLTRHPVLKDTWQDFESYRALEENKGLNLNTAAKSFLIDKGLLEPQRKGLEQGTGGTHVPVKHGYTAAEAKDLRENNHKEYMRLVLNGDLEIK